MIFLIYLKSNKVIYVVTFGICLFYPYFSSTRIITKSISKSKMPECRFWTSVLLTQYYSDYYCKITKKIDTPLAIMHSNHIHHVFTYSKAVVEVTFFYQVVELITDRIFSSLLLLIIIKTLTTLYYNYMAISYTFNLIFLQK